MLPYAHNPATHPVSRIIVLAIGCFLFIRCESDVPEFNGDNAMKHLVAQCDLGTREPGSTGHAAALTMYRSHFSVLADTVILQPFMFTNPLSGRKYECTNLIARFNRADSNRLLLSAHWDTRPWADYETRPELQRQPIPGANDGASGVAVLMEVASVLHETPPNIGVDIVLFDAEDSGIPGDNTSYCKGSEYFSHNIPVQKPGRGILVDMVGDRDLSLTMERYSFHKNPALVNTIWEIGRSRGFKPFKFSLGAQVYDDHVPLNEIAGIPTINIIDFDYPNPYTNYWHTLEDTPDKCSPKSLYIVGQVLLDYIYAQSNEKPHEKVDKSDHKNR